jgi:hypothetical protein
MNLSISNFKLTQRVWLLSFGVALALAIIFFLAAFKTPLFRAGGGVGQSDLQNCLIRAERYLYDLKDPDIVLVGTSRTARLRADLMGDRYYNLGYPCVGVLGGLYYIRQKPVPPKTVVLETTTFLEMTSYKVAIDEINHIAMPSIIKQYIPFLRQEYFVFPLLKHLGRFPLTKMPPPETMWFIPQRINLDTGRPHVTDPTGEDLYRRAREMDERIQSQKSKPIPAVPAGFLNSYVAYVWKEPSGGQHCGDGTAVGVAQSLVAYAKELEARGTRVVFQEIPETLAVQNLPCRNTLRKKIQELMPQSLYIVQSDHPYYTSDGIHLTPDESIHYSAILKRSLEAAHP